MKFRKKPVVVEAWQWFADSERGQGKGVCFDCHAGSYRLPAHVHTIHNNQAVQLAHGDWILPEPDGIHFYPVKPDIFAATYEPVEEPQ